MLRSSLFIPFLLAHCLLTHGDAKGLYPVDPSLHEAGLDGTTYYVSPDGNDAAAGDTANQPLRTLQAAADKLQAGDNLIARGGAYMTDDPEQYVLTLHVSGTPKRWIRIANYPDESPVIKIDGAGGVRLWGAAYVVLEGFTIIGNNDTMSSQAALEHAADYTASTVSDPRWVSTGITLDFIDGRYTHHIIVRNNSVSKCNGNGIGIKRADYVLIENNQVFENAFYSPWATSGISVWASWNFDRNTETYRSVVRNNFSFRNENRVPFWIMRKFTDGNGIIVDALINSQSDIAGDGYTESYSGRVLIENNICYDNGGRGINLFESERVDVINNTLHANSRHPDLDGEIGLGNVDHIRIHNNILSEREGQNSINEWRNLEGDGKYEADYNLTRTGQSNAGIAFGRHAVEADPGFSHAAAGDFQLAAGSAAIDAASARIFAETDISGRKRPNGRAADIGAHER